MKFEDYQLGQVLTIEEGICGFGVSGEGDIADAHAVRFSERSGHHDLAVVWRFGGGRDSFVENGLPRGVAVARALVEIQTGNVLYILLTNYAQIGEKHIERGSYVFCSPEGEISQPQGITENIAFAAASLLCNAVHFADDVRMVEIGEVLGTLAMRFKVVNNVRVVHQGL